MSELPLMGRNHSEGEKKRGRDKCCLYTLTRLVRRLWDVKYFVFRN